VSGLILMSFIGLALVPETRGRFIFADDSALDTAGPVEQAPVGDSRLA
jgi:hypothetical protein